MKNFLHQNKIVSIIVPCFNNEGSIKELWVEINKVREVLKGKPFNLNTKVVFIDDGSSDQTLLKLKVIKDREKEAVKLVKLTKNFGSYNAFLAGINYSEGDCHVYLHADLQDPPSLIPEMVSFWLKEIKFVVANRKERADKNLFSSLYHWTISSFGIKNIPKGGFDLILFDNDIKKEVLSIKEKDTNLVYLISWLGYPYVSIPYYREERKHGVSQWKLLSKIQLFSDSVFSFTRLPIYIVRLNTIVSIITFLATIVLVFIPTIPFTILFLALIYLALSGVLNIVLEYLLRVHEVVRKRPDFVVDWEK